MQRQSNEIGPLNPPSSGVFSYKDGYPIITFQIGTQPSILLGSTVKLNATVRVRNEAGLTPNNFNVLGTTERSGCLSNRAGCYGVFNQLTLATPDNHTLENLRHYSRYVSNQLNVNRSQADMDTNTGNSILMSSRSACTARGNNVDRSVSMPLVSGFLSEDHSLGMDGTGGLLISLSLSPDSTSLSGYYDNSNPPVFRNLTSAGWSVELSDVTLSYDTLSPPIEAQADMMKPKPSQIEFTSVSTIFSDITSSDATVNLALNKSKVLDVQSTFSPTSQINNYANDSFSMPKPRVSATTDAKISRVSYLRGSQLAPYQDELECEQESEQGRTLTELYIPSISAFQPYNKLSKTMMSSQTELGITTSKDFSGGDSNSLTLPDINQKNFSISVTQDPYNVGVSSLKNQTYGLRVVSDISNFSNGVFTFIKAKNILRRDAMGNVQILS